MAYCLLSAGVIFGYAALKPILIKEGVYRDRCTADEVEDGVDVCYGQEIRYHAPTTSSFDCTMCNSLTASRLNLMFTVAAVTTNVCALPVGSVLDKCGPRVTGSIGSVLVALGALLFANPSHFPYDGHLTGYLLIAIGGPFVFIPSFHLSNTFPKHSGLILSLLTGSFDCSSALFLLFRLLYGKEGGFFTIRSLFLLYLVVPGFIFVCQVLLMPSRSYSTVRELFQHAEEIRAEDDYAGGYHSDDPLSQTSDELSPRYQRLILKINSLVEDHPKTCDLPTPAIKLDPAWGILHASSPFEQFRSPWFVFITLFSVVQVLRVNYFISTIRPQYEYLLSSHDQAKQLNHLFDFFLPLGGLVAMPFIGLILDHAALFNILLLLAIGATVFGILGCIPHSLSAAYANISLFVIYRPYFYTVISDYAAKIFGFQTFGKVYGLIICLAGLGNFLQSPLDIVTMRLLGGNPVPVNIGLTGTGALIGGVLVIFVWRMRKLLRVGILTRGIADTGETERLLPETPNEVRDGLYGSQMRDEEVAD